jgi:hypothetical protein
LKALRTFADQYVNKFDSNGRRFTRDRLYDQAGTPIMLPEDSAHLGNFADWMNKVLI